MEKFWEFASEMKEKGVCIDLLVSGAIIEALKREKLDDMVVKWTEFHQSMKIDNGETDVVKDIVEVILGCDCSKKVENKLEKLKFPLYDEFLFKEFLVEMVNKFHLKPWRATYKIMSEMLLHDGKLKEAFNLLSMMMQQNYPPYPEPFIVCISKFGTVGDAMKFLRALPMKGSSSTAAYVKVISYFFEAGRHSEAKDLPYGCPRQVRNQKIIQRMFDLARSSSSS